MKYEKKIVRVERKLKKLAFKIAKAEAKRDRAIEKITKLEAAFANAQVDALEIGFVP